MHRTAIFCHYDPEGKVGGDIKKLLTDLKKNVCTLFTVVNGTLQEPDGFDGLADKVIVRENSGYDALAYKCAFSDEECRACIEKSDELVLCNGSFWGPFIPFEDIFSEMESTDADFWSLNLMDNGFYRYAQSYFLVYRKNIIENRELFDYFREYINDNLNDYYDIVYHFERNLFSHLTEKGYKAAGYSCSDRFMREDADAVVCYDGLPILKKKVFDSHWYDRGKVLNALKYIDEKYDYDISGILEEASRVFGADIGYEEVRAWNITIKERPEGIRAERSQQDVLDYIEENPGCYIYGTGGYASHIIRLAGGKGIKGFIVSNGYQEGKTAFHGLPVYPLSTILEKKPTVIVALNREHTNQVREKLTEFKNVLYLWGRVE